MTQGSSPLAGKKILTCEDEAITQLALRRTLLHAGLQVVGMAVTGEEAVEMATRERPDFVLMDILLPGIDGFEATRQILQVYRPCVVMVTAYSDQGHRDRAREVGADAYLTKPIGAAQLIAALEQIARDFSPG